MSLNHGRPSWLLPFLPASVPDLDRAGCVATCLAFDLGTLRFVAVNAADPEPLDSREDRREAARQCGRICVGLASLRRAKLSKAVGGRPRAGRDPHSRLPGPPGGPRPREHDRLLADLGSEIADHLERRPGLPRLIDLAAEVDDANGRRIQDALNGAVVSNPYIPTEEHPHFDAAAEGVDADDLAAWMLRRAADFNAEEAEAEAYAEFARFQLVCGQLAHPRPGG